jgi:hypothetical protein
MEIKVQWKNEPEVQQKIKMNMDKLGGKVRDAMREAAHETRDFMMFRGQEDIAEAGNFGDRWQEAFHVDVSETQRTFRVEASMQPEGPPVSYWKVFQYGADITAKNPSGYMWLPFRGTEGTDVWPSVYGGDLFRATSKKGTPLLGDKADKLNPWRYFGLASVHIPKKFHLIEVMEDEAKKAKVAFKRILDEIRRG